MREKELLSEKQTQFSERVLVKSRPLSGRTFKSVSPDKQNEASDWWTCFSKWFPPERSTPTRHIYQKCSALRHVVIFAKPAPHSNRNSRFTGGACEWHRQIHRGDFVCIALPALKRQIELISFSFFEPRTWNRCLLLFCIVPLRVCMGNNTNSPPFSLNLVLHGAVLFYLSSEVCMFTHSWDEIAAPKPCLRANKLFGGKMRSVPQLHIHPPSICRHW